MKDLHDYPNLTGVVDFVDQVTLALDHGLYYLALAGTLTIPDMMAALDNPAGLTTGDRYRQWFDTNVVPVRRPSASGERISLDGEMCWRFRCSLLHQGRTEAGEYDRIVFAEPGTGIKVDNVELLFPGRKTLAIDIEEFSGAVVFGAMKWLEAHHEDSHVAKNLERFVKREKDGLRPFIGGVTIIG